MHAHVRGIPVHYEEVGEGRPILIIHGWGTDHRFAVHRYEGLFEDRIGWRRIYPDMPGMGTTPGAAWIKSQNDMLAILLDFIEAVLPAERLTVIGVSWGGYMALGLARALGARLDGLMLTAPVVRAEGRDRHLPPRRILRADPDIAAQLQPGEAPWTKLAVIQDATTLAAFRAGVKPGLMIADWPFLAGVGPRYEASVVEDRLPEPLQAPALILTGRHDVACGYLDGWPLLEDLPRGTYAVLDGAGHGVEEEQPGLFRALAGEWLDRVEAFRPDA
jgi:pimeloyl-ACP methyl ester carboxylesterase